MSYCKWKIIANLFLQILKFCGKTLKNVRLKVSDPENQKTLKINFEKRGAKEGRRDVREKKTRGWRRKGKNKQCQNIINIIIIITFKIAYISFRLWVSNFLVAICINKWFQCMRSELFANGDHPGPKMEIGKFLFLTLFFGFKSSLFFLMRPFSSF